MPMVSMVGILIMTVLTVAIGRDKLMQVGPLLIVACLVHSSAGFGLGYFVCRLLGRDILTCRTIALEVGLQNSGMAAGLAKSLGKKTVMHVHASQFDCYFTEAGSFEKQVMHYRVSNQKVTGPSLVRLTCISAPKRPVSTLASSCRQVSTRRR